MRQPWLTGTLSDVGAGIEVDHPYEALVEHEHNPQGFRVRIQGLQKERTCEVCFCQAPAAVPFEDVEMGPVIGKGSFGYVCRAVYQNKVVAIKVGADKYTISNSIRAWFECVSAWLLLAPV